MLNTYETFRAFASFLEAVQQQRSFTAVGDDELCELFVNFSQEPAIIEKPIHRHVKSVFTWSPIVRQLIVTRSKLFIANLHFMRCWYLTLMHMK